MGWTARRCKRQVVAESVCELRAAMLRAAMMRAAMALRRNVARRNDVCCVLHAECCALRNACRMSMGRRGCANRRCW